MKIFLLSLKMNKDMTKYLDKSNRYTIGFASEISDRLQLSSFSSEEAFTDYVMTSSKMDYDMDPLEDYFLIRMYLTGQSVKNISSFLRRNERAVSLRLRMFLNIRNEMVFMKNTTDNEGIVLIIKAFYERAKRFCTFLHTKLVDNWIMQEFGVEDPDQILVNEIVLKKIV